ncbi:MAG: AI-2E family transporter [Candidatus Nanohaloarchaeota archaeon QJJ-9]|nr:AI-2E family transporter [Candidatus Nanohaloarchaeota archaeon QJJ-9]
MEEISVSNILLVFLIAGAFWTLWPFAGAILLGIYTAFCLYQLRDFVSVKVGNKVLTDSIIFLMLLGFVIFFGYGITTSLPAITSNIDSFFSSLSGSASFLIDIFNLPASFSTSISSIMEELSSSIRSGVVSQFRTFPSVGVNLFIYFVTSSYFYFEGAQIKERVDGFLESVTEKEPLIKGLSEDVERLFSEVYFVLTVKAIAAFIVSSISLYLLGVDFWWGWAALVGVFAFLPILRAFLVYVPLGLYYYFADRYMVAALVLAYGVLGVSYLSEYRVENFLVQNRSYREHSLILLLGFVAGGLSLGLKGFLLGPVLLVVTKNYLLNTYSSD